MSSEKRMHKGKGNREYKDSTLRMLYRRPENARELFMGLINRRVKAEDIIYEHSVGLFIKRLNHDLALRVGSECILITEEQSTPNENMPVRILIYIAELYDRYIRALSDTAIYKSKRIKLPTPYFFVFFYGKATDPPKWEQCLSDAFADSSDVNLELKVTVYNLNSCTGNAIFSQCPLLKGYATLVKEVESRRNEIGLDMAIKEAITYCKEHTALKEFLTEYESEVKANMLWEWDEEKAKQVYGDEQREEGRWLTLLANVKSLMKTLKCSADKAMDALEVPANEREALAAAL